MWPFLPAAEAQETTPTTGSGSGGGDGTANNDYPMGVGEVTGPLGVVLAVVLTLDRFGLLRRGGASGQTDTGQSPDATKHREEFVELRTHVQHLSARVDEDRRAAVRHREQVAQAVAELQSEVRAVLDSD